MRRRGNGSDAAWGYLLSVQDGPSPLELRLDKVTVGTLRSCTLRVDATVVGLPAAAAPQLVCEVLRDSADGGAAQLRSETNVVSVNGKQVQRGHKKHLQNGDRVSFRGDGAEYVFVHREESESFTAPQEVLDKYFIGHSLGAGGFGKVYMLFDKKLGYQRKAMKIVQPRDEKQAQFAEREARILMTLKHPCVIETYSIKQMGQRMFVVMEYLAGGDLTQFVNDQRPLSEAQTKLLFFQLALAVRYLHKRNICHRDLKPENILLQRRDPHSLIKVTDFGLAKDDLDHSSLKTFAGTKPYLAPEVIGDEKYTNAVDMWSIGVILFYSLTGVLPFRTLDEALRRDHVVKYDVQLWRLVSFQAQITVKSLLKVKASDRVSAARVLEDPWLRDDKMREDAFQLTGLKEIRPRPTSRPTPPAPASTAATQPTRRTFISPRGVLQYMKVDTGPDQHDGVPRSCLKSLRARPLMLGAVILAAIIILAFIGYGLWMYLMEDVNIFHSFGVDDSISNQNGSTSVPDGECWQVLSRDGRCFYRGFTAQRGPTGRKVASSALPTDGADRSRTV